MALLWKRFIRVEAANLRIEKPRIHVQLEKDSDKVSGSVVIYNLAPGTERVLTERNRIRITAGYETGARVGVILDGTVRRSQSKRTELSRKTTLEVSDHVHSPDRLGGYTSRSYNGSETIRNIVYDLASDLDLGVGTFAAIPPAATLDNWAHAGPTAKALTGVLTPLGLSWWEDDGLIRVAAQAGEPQPDLPILLVSQNTGMIGSPTPTDEGAEVTMFFDSRVAIGAQLVLDARNLQGSWKVIAYKHDLENWDGPFSTWCDVRRL